MFVVTDESELNWWLRRFAPRITLRLSPDFVEIASARGVAHSATVLTGSIPVFRLVDAVLPPDEVAARFLAVLLKRLPPSGGFIRPIVLVEGLRSLEGVLGGQQQAIVTRALATCGAAAAVIGN
jgi:hypothetical protein